MVEQKGMAVKLNPTGGAYAYAELESTTSRHREPEWAGQKGVRKMSKTYKGCSL